MNLNLRHSKTWYILMKERKIYGRPLSLLRMKGRFYENVSVEESQGRFYIQLDGKVVNTPLKNKLYAPTKQLGTAVMAEWSSQKNAIKPHQMHLTALCNTCIDNPQHLSKDEMIETTLDYLNSDTLCMRVPAEETEFISTMQQKKWDPVLEWFNKKFSVDVQWSAELFAPEQPKETLKTMRQILSNLNTWQLTGLKFSVDSLKSVIIPFAVIHKHLSVKEAVHLARLEVEIQMEKWGKVEWYHEMEQESQMAHLSAGILFYKLCSS